MEVQFDEVKFKECRLDRECGVGGPPAVAEGVIVLSIVQL